MKRVNQMRLYRLGNLTRLRALVAGEKPDQGVNSLPVVIIQLTAFTENEENQKTAAAAVEKAKKLLEFLHEIYVLDNPIDQNQINYAVALLNNFETSLEDDLERLPTYVVEPVAAYSFGQLINAAETVFPESMRKSGHIPDQVILDFRSAGACLAFDLPTACGFHVFRATDGMLRKYCNHFGGVLKGGGRDWGKYITALRDVLQDQSKPKKPNGRTIELIDSIRAIDRNPLVHPEQNLDSDGALLAFDLCKTAVSLMVTDIKGAP
jgi:hypothetical protein